MRHGKGPADRAGGNSNVFILNTIKIGIIPPTTLEEIAEYCALKFDKQIACTDEKPSHSLKKVFLHKEITRDKALPKMKMVIDTRKLQSIRNTGHEGVLEKKECSCCCAPCFHHTSPCENPNYLDEWEMVSVTHHKKKELKKLQNVMHKKDEKFTETQKLSKNHPKMDIKTTDTMVIDMEKDVYIGPKHANVASAIEVKKCALSPVMPNLIVQEDFHNKDWKVIL